MLKCWYVLRKRGTVVDFLRAFFAIFFGIKVFRAMQERIFLAVGQRILTVLTKQIGFTWQCSRNGQGNGVYLRYWLGLYCIGKRNRKRVEMKEVIGEPTATIENKFKKLQTRSGRLIHH
ncbi:hypothetical protein NPIL_165291 [Nephila pilipes]|uniref:Uncharacterized protein n=1 Tax=Nephila pilipes TaxID=299642 RepID=A0A8X6UJJ1_NEPPI|nr:hypothetical protein NPIL_165291 [Nephila pilipes]